MQRRPFLLAALIGASLLPAFAASAAAAAEPAPLRLKETVSVDVRGAQVLLTLTIINQGRATLWIPRELAPNQALTGRRYDLRNADGHPVPYIGKMIKRGPLTVADYMPIEGGKVLRSTVDIASSYAFKPGRHSYTVGYAGPVLSDLSRVATPVEFNARPESFTYSPR